MVTAKPVLRISVGNMHDTLSLCPIREGDDLFSLLDSAGKCLRLTYSLWLHTPKPCRQFVFHNLPSLGLATQPRRAFLNAQNIAYLENENRWLEGIHQLEHELDTKAISPAWVRRICARTKSFHTVRTLWWPLHSPEYCIWPIRCKALSQGARSRKNVRTKGVRVSVHA